MERKNAIEIVKQQAIRVEIRPNGNTRLYFSTMTLQKSMASFLHNHGVDMIEYLEGIEI